MKSVNSVDTIAVVGASEVKNAQYETALIDKNLLKQKLHEFYELENQREKFDKK